MPATAPGPGDVELVDKARRGDGSAFEQLVARHRDVVFRVAARIVGPDAAADVSQDVFLRAFNHLGDFEGRGAFRSWLLQIARNAALNEIARKHPEPAGESTELEGEDPPLRGPQRTPAQQLEDRERADRLAVKLRELRLEHRTVLVLRDLEGLSYDEIAVATESPLGSVKGRIHRARAELIEVLRNNTYDWELPDG